MGLKHTKRNPEQLSQIANLQAKGSAGQRKDLSEVRQHRHNLRRVRQGKRRSRSPTRSSLAHAMANLLKWPLPLAPQRNGRA